MDTLDLFRLDGRTAIVTGGGRGLGRYMAEALSDAGGAMRYPTSVAPIVASRGSPADDRGRPRPRPRAPRLRTRAPLPTSARPAPPQRALAPPRWAGPSAPAGLLRAAGVRAAAGQGPRAAPFLSAARE